MNRGLLGGLIMLYEVSAVLYGIYWVFEACNGVDVPLHEQGATTFGTAMEAYGSDI